MNFLEKIEKLAADCTEFSSCSDIDVKNLITQINDIRKGDYALPCFSLSKTLGVSPVVIAENAAKQINDKIAQNKDLQTVITKAEAAAGYLNFFLNKDTFCKNVFNLYTKDKQNFFYSDQGKQKTIILDFASVNLAKHYHIGHLRNTLIGACLSNIYSALNYKIVKWNYLGDYGTPYGNIIAYIKRENINLETADVDVLQKSYASAVALAEENDTEFIAEGRLWFKKITEGDKEAVEIYKKIRQITLTETSKLLQKLNVKFDREDGEYYFSKFTDEYLNKLKDKNLLTKSQGAEIVDLTDYGLEVALILSSRNTTQYLTRDIAAAYQRFKEYNFDKMIYITGSEQILNFKQLFKILELMDCGFADKLYHLVHGRYSLKEGKLSSRYGGKALMKDILNAAEEKAREIIAEKDRNNFTEKEIDKLASDIGIGAVAFNILSLNLNKDVVFDIEKSLAFDGETGPYLQYTYARICSVLSKCGNFTEEELDNLAPQSLTDEEFILNKLVLGFKQTLEQVIFKNEPAILSRTLIDLAKNFNKFYNENKILCDDLSLRKSRIKTIVMVKDAIKNGLTLLNITATEKM